VAVALETDLRKMAHHLVERLDLARTIITLEDGSVAFKKVEYGEPSVILDWPYLSVMPMEKSRELITTRQYQILFSIHIILYHGQVSDTHDIQEQTHERAEAVERFLMTDRQWNFIDDNPDNNKIVHGLVTSLDHTFIIMVGTDNLWSASRLQLVGQSREYFNANVV
jgi:hypothetical protein